MLVQPWPISSGRCSTAPNFGSIIEAKGAVMSSARLDRLLRRDLLKLTAAGVVGYSLSGWLEALADDAATDQRRRQSCILLWMSGGPSQIDTFDPKPGHANGGPFHAIPTSVPG